VTVNTGGEDCHGVVIEARAPQNLGDCVLVRFDGPETYARDRPRPGERPRAPQSWIPREYVREYDDDPTPGLHDDPDGPWGGGFAPNH
jgi:hypothetical protein